MDNKALACSIADALRILYSGDDPATVDFYPAGEVFASLGAEHDSDGPVVVEPMLIEPNADIAAEFSAFVSAKGRAPEIVVVRGLGGFKISANRKIGQAVGLPKDGVGCDTKERSSKL